MLTESDISRFWSKVDIAAGCWEWTASKVQGYGQIVIGGRKGNVLRAHRISWELSNGSIPHGMFVCHHCDNRACVNPAHLFLGTQQDNMDDMYAKGRDKTRKKPRKPRKLTDDQILLIRADKRPQKDISAEYGVTEGYISMVKNNRRRQYI